MGATATQQEIRKACHKLALRFHPDKNKDDEVSTLLLLFSFLVSMGICLYFTVMFLIMFLSFLKTGS